MKTAQDIINNARFDLVTLIVTLMRKIDAYLETGDKRLMTDPEESVVLDFAECVTSPSIVVEDIGRPRNLDFIATSDDHNFYVSAGEADIDADDISTDELVAIAKVLENTYNEF